MSYVQHDESDLLVPALELEDKFYREGYDLGIADGRRAGLIEGRAFGIEKGFEKYVSMGRLNGRASIWAGRLPTEKASDTESVSKLPLYKQVEQIEQSRQVASKSDLVLEAGPILAISPRWESNVRTLYALTEMGSLSTDNDEATIAEFDDRLRRAEGKLKVIEKSTGEASSKSLGSSQNQKKDKQTIGGNIEDISVLSARH